MEQKVSQEGSVWVYPPSNPVFLKQIVKEFNVPEATAQTFISRGFTTLEEIHQFLYGQLPDLFDPFLLNGMEKAVERLFKALSLKEKILIYGDNDVDGMTGVALLVEFFRLFGLNVYGSVPNRSDALRDRPLLDSLEKAKKYKATLVITVDCGISAGSDMAALIKAGVDVIITDHHEPTDNIPLCIATLNPKLKKNEYPNRDLTGVGVAFKLAHALLTYAVDRGIAPKIDLKKFLDLVALGTVADMGSLIGENRILVKYGVKQIRKTKRPGLMKLFELCGITPKEFLSTDISFKIAPRINSLGRISDPQKGLALLMTKSSEEATLLAKELEVNNQERQRIERHIVEDIENMISANPELIQGYSLAFFSSSWHPGVIPIISARLTRQYNRPTLILAEDKGVFKGSMRSIKKFPLISFLKKYKNLLVTFGGHDLAAGLTVKREYLETIIHHFKKDSAESLLPEDVKLKLYLDAAVSFDQINFDLIDSIKLFEPFGNENPPPMFYAKAQQMWPAKITGKVHLKMFLEENERILEGLALQKSYWKPYLNHLKTPIKVAFTPQITARKDTLQLLIKDFIFIDKKNDGINSDL